MRTSHVKRLTDPLDAGRRRVVCDHDGIEYGAQLFGAYETSSGTLPQYARTTVLEMK